MQRPELRHSCHLGEVCSIDIAGFTESRSKQLRNAPPGRLAFGVDNPVDAADIRSA